MTGSETTLDQPIDVVPLGGLREFGMNTMAITCGDTTIVVDAGVMFPEPDLPGVDTVEDQLAIARKKGGIGPAEPVALERFEVVRHR